MPGARQLQDGGRIRKRDPAPRSNHHRFRDEPAAHNYPTMTAMAADRPATAAADRDEVERVVIGHPDAIS